MSGVLPFTEANRKIVTLYYRRSLKLAYSWINKRDHFRAKAMEIRQLFEANKHVSDAKQLQILLKNTESLLKKYDHPDPIVPALRPGGTKFERNIPPPMKDPIPGHY